MAKSFCCAVFCCRRSPYPAKTFLAEDAGEKRRVPSSGDGPDGVASETAELQALQTDYHGGVDGKLLERVAELERLNADLRGQLEKNNRSKNDYPSNAHDENPSKEETIASLKSEVESLKEEKLQVEWRLAREIEKSKKRKEDSRKKRDSLKCKLASMSETLVEDKVLRSYERE